MAAANNWHWWVDMRSCAKCGAPLPLQTGRGQRRKMCATCSPSRNRKPTKTAPKPTVKPQTVQRSIVSVTTAELTEAGMLDSHQGQAALLLAHRLESGEDTGAAMAQMVRQLQLTMASALASVEPDEVDPVDELKARRESRGA